ncbi:MAG: LPS assembly protein LptD [Desulfuromonadaceae bacterium]|nr:LPS assembly protein LptD [Desulfuromonadaceae bacterium]
MPVLKFTLFVYVAFLLWLGGPSVGSWSKQASAADYDDSAPVSLQADTLERDADSGKYTATGNVHIEQKNVELQADSVHFDPAAGDADAAGHVFMSDPDGYMYGEQMQVNMNTATGVVYNGGGFISAYDFRLSGSEIEKLSDERYRIENGFFTTCKGPVPAWKFGARNLKVTQEGFAQAYHVKFYLKDLPILYLPYITYPVRTKRSSGFLLPMAGYSSKRGMQLSLAYYQVLGRNQDATIYLDHFSDMGIGTGLEYRYIFGQDNAGVANLYYVSTYGSSNYDDLSDRYAWRWEHLGTLPGDVRVSVDSEYVSKRDYFEDFGTVAEEYDKDEVQTSAALSKVWDKWALTSRILYTKDLREGADNDYTLQRLPEVQLNYMRTRIADTFLYAKFDSEGTYFWRRKGLTGTRVNIRPSLAAFFMPLGIFELEPEIGYRQRAYKTSADKYTNEEEGSEHAENWDFSTRIGTRVSRVFELADTGLTKVQHSIEPEIIYSYTPRKNQDHLPYFDSDDRVEHENKVEYALVNRLTGKFENNLGNPTYRELVYLKLSQEYDIWVSRRDREERYGYDRFSSIKGELILRPLSSWSIDMSSTYNPHQNELERFNARTTYTAAPERNLALEYRYNQDVTEYAAARVELDLFKPVYLIYEKRLDLLESERLENVVHLEYREQCWSFFVSYRNTLDSHEVMLSFALTGAGRVAKIGGSLGIGDDDNNDDRGIGSIPGRN